MEKQKKYFKIDNFNKQMLLRNSFKMKIMIYALPTIIFFSCSSKTEESTINEIKTFPIISLNKIDTVSFKEYPATIEGIMDIEIRSRVDGHLTQLYVDEGSYVNKGDNLFKIDDLPYLELYNEALAKLHEAENSLNNAKLELDRLVPLIENKISSEYELKIAENNYKIAQTKVKQANSLVKTTKINIDFTIIKAPISGYVGRIPKKIGSLITRNDIEPLTGLSNVEQVFVYFALSEKDFNYFKDTYNGNTLTDKIKQVPAVSLLLVDNECYIETGRIDMVNGQFDRTTGSITLRAIFPNSKALIRSGNTGKIQIRIDHKDVLSIPQSATFDIQDKTFVYVLDKHNKVRAEAIEVITNSGNNYLLKSNLTFGDRIVSKDIDALTDGDTINPFEENL